MESKIFARWLLLTMMEMAASPSSLLSGSCFQEALQPPHSAASAIVAATLEQDHQALG